MDTYETTAAIQRLRDDGVSLTEISKRVGRSAGWVTRHLDVLRRGIPSVLKAWERGSISYQIARKVSRRPASEQDMSLAEYFTEDDDELIAKLREVRGLDYVITGQLGHIFLNDSYITTISLINVLSTRGEAP